MRFLTVEEVLRIHARVVEEGPPDAPRHSGIRAIGDIEGASGARAMGAL